MDRQQYINNLLDKFDKDSNDPTLSQMEREIVIRIKQLYLSVEEMNTTVKTLSDEINIRNQQIAQLQVKIEHELGRIEGIAEALYTAAVVYGS